MTTAQPGRDSEEFLRALLKPSAKNAEKLDEETRDDDDPQQDGVVDDGEDS